jgi:glycine hydroxymethyltransferase
VANVALTAYLKNHAPAAIDAGFLGYLANLTSVAQVAPVVAKAIVAELADQRSNLKLIASENYCSLATQLAMGNLLTDKYAEGVAGSRFYEGCDNVDEIEAYAAAQACKLFGCDHAYVQPHSGADANMIAFWAILQAKIGAPGLEDAGVKDPSKLTHEQWEHLRAQLGNQRMLGMDLASGGHLTHGYRHNVSAKMFEAFTYSVNPATGLLDYDALEQQALEVKPLILLAGYSSYPRALDFERLRAIADQTGSVLMVDMAHFAGLVAGGLFSGAQNPIPYADIVTSTTHKTLRGPRGGIVLCRKEYAEFVDKGCPLVIGGPLPHVMAAKAVAFTEANRPEFRDYARRIVENSQALAAACQKEGLDVVSGGTDNHLLVVDVRSCGITGRQAAGALNDCHITLNKNAVPADPQGPMVTSGLRLGTPAVTTLGMGPEEMREIASCIRIVLDATEPEVLTDGVNAGTASKMKYKVDPTACAQVQARVRVLLDRFPVYPELDLAFLQEHFG